MREFIMFVLALACAQEMLVTKEYTDYLKKHVTFEVVDYEDNIFRGWTVDEFKEILLEDIPNEGFIPEMEPEENLPSSINWEGANCDHGVINQGRCGSSWAVAVAEMMSDRCCLQIKDYGWLSIQELVSCDPRSHGCRGGWCTWAMDYIQSAGGLVPESCFPYTATNGYCPTKCVDGSEFKAAHVCPCKSYKKCIGVSAMKTCLQTGPVTVGFTVCRSFINYKSGIYKCVCNGRYLGLHTMLAMGYSDSPEPNYYVKNSWSTAWGNKGYVNIGVNECGISGTYPNGNVMCEKIGKQALFFHILGF